MCLGQINPSEPITRVIFYHRHFDATDAKVKFGAFLPPAKSHGSSIPADQRTTSICRVKGLGEEEIWVKADRIAGTRPPPRARADLPARAVTEIGLQIDVGTGQTRHAEIVGWESESHILEMAGKLALAATLVLR